MKIARITTISICLVLFINAYTTAKTVPAQDVVFIRVKTVPQKGPLRRAVLDVTWRAGVVTVTHLAKKACEDQFFHRQKILTREESKPVLQVLDRLVDRMFTLPAPKDKKAAKEAGIMEFWFGRGRRFGRFFIKPEKLSQCPACAAAWLWLKSEVLTNARISFDEMYGAIGPTGVLNVLTTSNQAVLIDGWLQVEGPTISIELPPGKHTVMLQGQSQTKRLVDIHKDLPVTIDYSGQ